MIETPKSRSPHPQIGVLNALRGDGCFEFVAEMKMGAFIKEIRGIRREQVDARGHKFFLKSSQIEISPVL